MQGKAQVCTLYRTAQCYGLIIFHQLNQINFKKNLKIHADPWLKPVTFHSSTQQELGRSKSKFYGDPVAALDSDVIEEEKRPFNESQKNR